MKKHFLLAVFTIVLSTAQSQAEVIFDSPLSGDELAMGNLLKWSTSFEENTDMFIIEKSTDGNNFVNIGNVKAIGDSEEVNTYRFMDTRLGAGKSYYRLKIVTLNGTSNYSEMAAIQKEVPNQFSVVAYSPTMAQKEFDVTIDALSEGQLEYQVVSYQGELVYNDFQFLYPGLNELQVSLEDMTEGIYKLKLRLDEEEETLVIQKPGDEMMKKMNMASTKKIKKD